MNLQEYNEDMAKDWIEYFRIEEQEVAKALKDLFERQLILIEEQSRFQDRIEKLEKLAKKVEGLI